MDWLLVGAGGFVGAALRFYASKFIQNGAVTFPLGTLGVNIIGSFILGFVMFSSEYSSFFDRNTRLFLGIGLLGAFTTMSTFSYETFKLLEKNDFFMFSLNIIGTILLCLSAIYLSRLVVLNIYGT